MVIFKSYCCQLVKLSIISMHIDHEIVEYVTTEEPEYEEIMEVIEEEIPVQAGAPEPSTTDFVVL
jgi:hypothetical protein